MHQIKILVFLRPFIESMGLEYFGNILLSNYKQLNLQIYLFVFQSLNNFEYFFHLETTKTNYKIAFNPILSVQ